MHPVLAQLVNLAAAALAGTGGCHAGIWACRRLPRPPGRPVNADARTVRYPRAELRPQLVRTEPAPATWSARSGVHVMTGTCRIVHIAADRPSVRRRTARALRRWADPYSYPPPAPAWRRRRGKGKRR